MGNGAYLILDPIGSYAARLKVFLDRLGLPAIAVFTSVTRLAGWERRWKARLGENVVGEVLADGSRDLAEVAAEILSEWPHGFYGIVPWDELHVVTGAALSEQLGLGWNPKRVVERCRDKAVMKAWLRSRGTVRVNAAQVVSTAEQALAFQAAVGRWPIVVKPSGGAGSMNVFFAESTGQLLGACQRVKQAGMGLVLLEEFVHGQEYAVNGLVDRKHDFLVTDVWTYDKRESHGIPNLYYQSIKLGSNEEPFWDLARYAAAVVEALELRRSPVHMEVKVDDRGPCLIEVGARMAGGDQPVLASKVHGRSLFELAACHYLDELPLSGRDVDFARYDSLSARIVSGISPSEIPRVKAIHGLEEVSTLASFEGFGTLRPPGTRLPQTRDLDTKSYEVYLIHPDPDQVEHDARLIRRLLWYE